MLTSRVLFFRKQPSLRFSDFSIGKRLLKINEQLHNKSLLYSPIYTFALADEPVSDQPHWP